MLTDCCEQDEANDTNKISVASIAVPRYLVIIFIYCTRIADRCLKVSYQVRSIVLLDSVCYGY